MNEILPIFFLYAEIHYKVFGKINFLWKNLPEIVADLPYRVEPGIDLPVFCLIKDAHLFPVTLSRIDIEIIYPDGDCEKFLFPLHELFIDERFWGKEYFIRIKEGFSGYIKANVYISCLAGGKDYYFKNDNYRKIFHRPFDVFVAKDNLPSFEGCVNGDMHYHSYFTSDIVEFGAPLDFAKETAAACGLEFFVSADHSYDFVYYNHQLEHDVREKKQWEKALKEAADVNREPAVCSNKKVIVFQGEEVSCGNSEGNNIHLVIFNNRKFFHGSGDSVLEWFKNNPDDSLENILGKVEDDALVYAAHPDVSVSIIEKIILKRSRWTDTDYLHKRLTGLQILNGIVNAGFFNGLQKWKQVLLKGEKKFVVAGSDAHGNFNLYRQMRPPFVLIYEHTKQRFANVWTGVYINEELNENAVISALKRGACYITNGPAARIFVSNEKNETKEMGETLEGKAFVLTIEAISTEEFGRISTINIFLGDLDSQKEYLFKSFQNISLYLVKEQMRLLLPCVSFYVRAVVETIRKGGKYICCTNPVWIKKKVLK
ncbi:hypothetical protein ACFL40_01635 [candidate division KSB1 bacterium]